MSHEEKELEAYRERQEQYRRMEREGRHAEAADARYDNWGRDSDAAYDDWAGR